MSIAHPNVGRHRAPLLPLRFALRELRGGLRGFYVFIACIALGVMAIAGVGSVAASLSEGLAREGRTLLGGDVAFSLIQREAKPDEVAFLRSRGALSVAAESLELPERPVARSVVAGDRSVVPDGMPVGLLGEASVVPAAAPAALDVSRLAAAL